jgi:RNA polymerase sigma factor (sigma-70 family)
MRESHAENAVRNAVRLSEGWRLPPNFSRTEWEEEAYGCAAQAIVEAEERFDPHYGIPIDTYLICAAMAALRTLRKNHWRRWRRMSMRPDAAAASLAGTLRIGHAAVACEPSSARKERIALREALADLPAVDRRLLLDYFEGGWTQRELALRLGISQPAVNKRLTRILKRLRRMLDE